MIQFMRDEKMARLESPIAAREDALTDARVRTDVVDATTRVIAAVLASSASNLGEAKSLEHGLYIREVGDNNLWLVVFLRCDPTSAMKDALATLGQLPFHVLLKNPDFCDRPSDLEGEPHALNIELDADIGDIIDSVGLDILAQRSDVLALLPGPACLDSVWQIDEGAVWVVVKCLNMRPAGEPRLPTLCGDLRVVVLEGTSGLLGKGATWQQPCG